MSYSSSCQHHLHHPCSRKIPNGVILVLANAGPHAVFSDVIKTFFQDEDLNFKTNTRLRNDLYCVEWDIKP